MPATATLDPLRSTVRVDARGIPHAGRPDEPPFRVPDWTNEVQRIDMLDELVLLGMQSEQLRADARELYAVALYRTRQRVPSATRPSEEDIGQVLLEFVQAGGYRADPAGEWYQGPEYTRFYAGNCNDTAVLYATLANLCGLPAEVWWLKQDQIPGARLDHVTTGVRHERAEVCWAETTIPGARYCENPYRALTRTRAAARYAANLGL